MWNAAEPAQRPQTRHSSLVKVNKESKLKGRFTVLWHTCKARLGNAGISVGCTQISHVTPQGAMMISNVLCSLTFSCTMSQTLAWTSYIHFIRTSASSDAHLMWTQSLTLAVIESVKSRTGSWQAPHCSDICRNSLPHPPPPTPCIGICQSVSGAQLQQGMWRISPPLCPPLSSISIYPLCLREALIMEFL